MSVSPSLESARRTIRRQPAGGARLGWPGAHIGTARGGVVRRPPSFLFPSLSFSLCHAAAAPRSIAAASPSGRSPPIQTVRIRSCSRNYPSCRCVPLLVATAAALCVCVTTWGDTKREPAPALRSYSNQSQSQFSAARCFSPFQSLTEGVGGSPPRNASQELPSVHVFLVLASFVSPHWLVADAALTDAMLCRKKSG